MTNYHSDSAHQSTQRLIHATMPFISGALAVEDLGGEAFEEGNFVGLAEAVSHGHEVG
jgi:hypothetical protein